MYWPDEEGKTLNVGFGLTVYLADDATFNGYKLRTLLLSNVTRFAIIILVTIDMITSLLSRLRTANQSPFQSLNSSSLTGKVTEHHWIG